tara:strand:+ start:713 stop:859 length:147 start_codon:yes stop_codon:yes gene_type:complete
LRRAGRESDGLGRQAGGYSSRSLGFAYGFMQFVESIGHSIAMGEEALL